MFAEILKNLDDDTVGELLKGIYGLVQAGCQWQKNGICPGKKLVFERSKNDPCLFFRRDEKGEIVLCLYLNDSAMIGDETVVNDNHEELSKYFMVVLSSKNPKDFYSTNQD
mgnify:CR=1 FL=1